MKLSHEYIIKYITNKFPDYLFKERIDTKFDDYLWFENEKDEHLYYQLKTNTHFKRHYLYKGLDEDDSLGNYYKMMVFDLEMKEIIAGE